MCEEYNGWTNRETWATSLHIDNDESLQNEASEKISASFLEDMDNEKEDGWQDGVTSAEDSLKDWVEDLLSFEYWEDMGGMPKGIQSMLKDIGSLYRVNWREIAENWLEDEIQGFKDGKYKEEEEQGNGTKYTFICDPDECDSMLEFTAKDGFGFPNGVVEMNCACGRKMQHISTEVQE